jgi:dihydrofolate reductase
MRKIILLMHASLDGYVAGPNGEMDWITFDDDLATHVDKFIEDCDAVIYGRITFQMMENYWPTAGDEPDAGQHQITHAKWVNNAEKIVFSKTLNKSDWNNTTFVNDTLEAEMRKRKQQTGKNMILIGSASIAHQFMHNDLIDEYLINVNPVLVGNGLPLFKSIAHKKKLQLLSASTFTSGVVGLHYQAISSGLL